MTARRALTWRVPGTPAQILRRLADPQVARRRAESDPAVRAEVTELSGGEDELVTTMVAQLPQEWIPGQVRGRLPGTPRIVRREVWRIADDGAAVGAIDVDVSSVPATTMTSTGRIVPCADDAGASELHYELSLTVALPLVGGVIERAVLDHICHGYDKEAHVIAES